ncbi:MAG: hypothetical protein K0S93_853 [Nitrososphaeraceae archaeon]|nr:hypothetical protein [Nitrososphaeraceae archaeon]
MKNNNIDKKEILQKNTFEQSRFRDITTNPKAVYIDDIKITINSEKLYKKLFYLPKKNKRIYFMNSLLIINKFIIMVMNLLINSNNNKNNVTVWKQ